MKKGILIIFAALLLTGCAQSTANTAMQESLPIEPQTEPAGTESAAEDSALQEGWVLDLLEGIFGYDEPYVPESSQEPQQIPPVETVPPMTEEDLQSLYTLTVDDTGLVTRTEGNGARNLGWVIEFNGEIVLERVAENELTYRPMNYGNGTYRVWLTAYFNGYTQVSNVVEFTRPSDGRAQQDDVVDEWTRSIITAKKGHLKHLVRVIRGMYGSPEYKLGFIIDPDHDGYYNGVSFCAGRGDYGELVQYVYDNDSSDIHFSTARYAEDGIVCTLGIWCDAASGKDYIVRIEQDGTAYDCCTEEVIPDFAEDDGFFTFTDEAPYDCDHFYVSYGGVPVWEGA